jgi:alkanesulfonate monooxygenase SsuD/methylene tetrahydromethanopterin reductase-like flavin-dependent oxidoreductase (luciferase family)
MLDQMSGGRLELGIGRGISPIEFGYFGVDFAKDSQPMYLEAYQVLLQALTSKRVNFEGKYYRFRDAPMTLEPLQKPHPPLWYGLSNAESTEWAARTGLNVVSNRPGHVVREIVSRYRAEWKKLGREETKLPFIGFTRHLVISNSAEEAKVVARRAYRAWFASFIKLWREHGHDESFLPYPEDFDELVKRGQAIAGTPAEVRAAIARQVEETGINYLLLRFAFGDLTLAESLRSVRLFGAAIGRRSPGGPGRRPTARRPRARPARAR